MFRRFLNIPERQSFFLFGPRGTGKSTLLKECFPNEALYIDLLFPKEEVRFLRDPELLIQLVEKQNPKIVIIDEVQKLPKLLDVVHSLIESHGTRFALTGSSARKLKRGQANLLAGRAIVRELFPLTAKELGDSFDLDSALAFGTLPKIFQLESVKEKNDFLDSYANIYIKEEVYSEAILRKLEPFRKFLTLSAQLSGKTLNLKSLASSVGVDPKTIRSYYSILEDTLVGFFLEPLESSLKKKLGKSPKFFFFDSGVTRALSEWLDLAPLESTSYFGDVFEQWLITEIFRIIRYQGQKVHLNFHLVHDSYEIDLVMTWPRERPIFVEIKSTQTVEKGHLKGLQNAAKDFPDSKLYLISRDPYRRNIGAVECMCWKDFLNLLWSNTNLAQTAD